MVISGLQKYFIFRIRILIWLITVMRSKVKELFTCSSAIVISHSFLRFQTEKTNKSISTKENPNTWYCHFVHRYCMVLSKHNRKVFHLNCIILIFSLLLCAVPGMFFNLYVSTSQQHQIPNKTNITLNRTFVFYFTRINFPLAIS